MAINYENLVKEIHSGKLDSSEKCPKGNHPLGRHPDEYQQYTIKKIPVCENCYFDNFGKGIEKFSLGVPHKTIRDRG